LNFLNTDFGKIDAILNTIENSLQANKTATKKLELFHIKLRENNKRVFYNLYSLLKELKPTINNISVFCYNSLFYIQSEYLWHFTSYVLECSYFDRKSIYFSPVRSGKVILLSGRILRWFFFLLLRRTFLRKVKYEHFRFYTIQKSFVFKKK